MKMQRMKGKLGEQGRGWLLKMLAAADKNEMPNIIFSLPHPISLSLRRRRRIS